MSGRREEVDEVLHELRAVRSSDPCASIAMTTIKATIHTLETRWLDRRPRRPEPSDEV